MGLRVGIYRQAGVEPGSDISDTVDHLTVVNISGPHQPQDDAPAFKLERHHYYPEMPLLYPVGLTDREGMRGPMAGGNYAGIPDSRWHAALKAIVGNRSCIAKHQAAIDRVTDGDRRFFERHPGRTYRVRLASAAEVEMAGAALDVDTAPVQRGRHVMLVRNLEPGVRLRVMAQAWDWMAGDLDSVGEDEAARAYRWTCRPGTEAHRVEREAIAALRASGALS